MTVTEVCPYCEEEITMEWDVTNRGYKAYCPVCGSRLMLCDECQHGEPGYSCNYNSETDTCRHNRPKFWTDGEKHMNITVCPHCGGRVNSVNIGWKCESCRGFIDMQGQFHAHKEDPFMPPLTNADCIRRMSDKELARFLCDFRSCDSGEHPCNGCEAEPYCKTGHNGMIDWLQQLAKEDTQ